MKVKAVAEHSQHPVTMSGAAGAQMRMLVGPDEDARNFHMRHFEVEPGGYTPHHKHDYEHEILILKGEGVAQSEQGEKRICAGDVIWVPPNEMHQFRNTGKSPLEFICLIPAPQVCAT